MQANQPQLPQTLHDAAAGPRFSTINLTPLPDGLAGSATIDPTASVSTPGEVTNPETSSPTNEQVAMQEQLLTADSTPPQAQPSGTTLAGVAVAAGAGLLLWALWQWGRKGAVSRREAAFQSKVIAASPHTTMPVPSVAAPVSTPSPAHQQLIAAADRIAKQLEQRAGQLERFIEQADHRIIELKRLSMTPVAVKAVDAATPTTATNIPAQRSQFPRSTREATKPAVPVAPIVPQANATAKSANAMTSAAFTTAPISTNPAAASLSSQHAEVHALADAGLTPVEIAKRLSKPTGQIELILNLRKASMVA